MVEMMNNVQALPVRPRFLNRRSASQTGPPDHDILLAAIASRLRACVDTPAEGPEAVRALVHDCARAMEQLRPSLSQQRGSVDRIERELQDVRAALAAARIELAGTRDGERRVISRLLEGPPHVLATGGGAFMSPETRELIKSRAVSVWLKADLGVLAQRLGRKDTRPLLTGKDPMEVLRAQAEARYPVYAQADIVVQTGDTAHHVTVGEVIRALTAHLGEVSE